MSFKYAIGQTVEYGPMGKSVGRFTVGRHMPIEDGDGERKYRIKSISEGFERTVAEHDLTATDKPESAYISTGARMR